MSLASTEWRKMLPHTVVVRTRASRNTDGSDTFSTSASTYRARVNNVRKWVRDASGASVMTSAVAWIASTGTLASDSKYTLPDGTNPPVLLAEALSDEDGVYHNRVTFGA